MSKEINKAYKDFLEYSNSIKKYNRFFVDEKYLNYFNVLIKEKEKKILKGTIFFRSRIHKLNQGNKVYENEEIGMPKGNLIFSSGRANPKGINYFYLSENEYTSVSEVRPVIKDKITIGSFRNLKALSIVVIDNLATISSSAIDKNGRVLTDIEIREEADQIMFFMLYLMKGFTSPLKGDPDVEYAPYQYFCEYCKQKGFDGIKYSSSLIEGASNNNYVFFSDKDFELINKVQVEVKKIKCEFV